MAQSSVETYPVMSVAEHFGRLTDPRMEERVIVIAICGADSWVEIEEFEGETGVVEGIFRPAQWYPLP
jgi:hypothetical protein